MFGCLKSPLVRVVDDVLEAHIDRLVAELHREHLVRLVSQAVQELRVDRRRFLPDQPGERGSFRAVSLARRAEASEQVHLKLRRLGEFVGRQLGGSLVEIVGDAHRTNRVRAGRPRAHLVELVHGRQHRSLSLLHDIQVRRERRRRPCLRLRLASPAASWRRPSPFSLRPRQRDPSSLRQHRPRRSVSGNCGDPRRVEPPVRSIGSYPPADPPERLHGVLCSAGFVTRFLIFFV